MENNKLDTLSKIAKKYDTDKGIVHHNYTPIYNSYFESIRMKPIKVLEIGFGGYEYFDRGGGSAKMWREYFPNANIITCDIYPKYPIKGVSFYNLSEVGIHLFDISYNSDIIIDDGSHINYEVINTFKEIFPNLKSGGIYVIEDVETSYWNEHGYGGNPDINAKGTTMDFFLKLTHQVNHQNLKEEFRNEFSGQIEFVHFYRNLIIIKKK
jgi:hypothetical protein